MHKAYIIILESIQSKLEVVNEAMNYLSFILFYPELDIISEILVKVLSDNHNLEEMSNEFFLKMLIIEGRYYYLHENYDHSQRAFDKALLIANECGYQLKESYFEHSTSISTTSTTFKESDIEIPEVLFDIPFYLFLIKSKTKSKEDIYKEGQLILEKFNKNRKVNRKLQDDDSYQLKDFVPSDISKDCFNKLTAFEDFMTMMTECKSGKDDEQLDEGTNIIPLAIGAALLALGAFIIYKSKDRS